MNPFFLCILLISQQPIQQTENVKPETFAEETTLAQPDPLFPARLFETVEEKVKGIPTSESDTYYQILNEVRNIPEEDLKNHAKQFSEFRSSQLKSNSSLKNSSHTFVDMFKYPELYQGMAVQLTGHARKIIEYPAGENEFGIDRIYECWLYTEDSQSNPAVIITTHIPEGIPIGEDLTDPVEIVTVNGIFYKKYVYSARDTMRMAPMILAHQIHWKPVIPKEKREFGRNWYITVIVSFFLIFLILYRLGNSKTNRHLIAKDRLIEKPVNEDTPS